MENTNRKFTVVACDKNSSKTETTTIDLNSENWKQEIADFIEEVCFIKFYMDFDGIGLNEDDFQQVDGFLFNI